MKRQRGFTLIELLVATAIFFIMSAMVYSMLDGVRRQLVFSEDAEKSLRDLHYAMRRLTMDISQLQPRPIREEIGDGWQPAVSSEGGTNTIELSIGGWRNPTALPRGNIQRIAYVVDDDTLVRLHWPVLDKTLATEPLRTELMPGIVDIRVRFMTDAGEWVEQWPPLGDNVDPRTRPRAIEFLIEHEVWGEIDRIIEIAG